MSACHSALCLLHPHPVPPLKGEGGQVTNDQGEGGQVTNDQAKGVLK